MFYSVNLHIMVRIIHFLSLFILISGIILITGCISSNNNEEKSSSQSNFDLNQIADVGLVVHNHWTDKDVNDGKIVYIDLINKRNEALGKSDNADIHGMTVKIRIFGYDYATNDYTIELFNKVYPNLNYYDINYPQGGQIVIFFNEIAKYENELNPLISAEITLPDGRILKTHDPHDFDI